MQLRQDAAHNFYLPNAREVPVYSLEDSLAAVNAGLENRVMAPTLMNATSSRSHTVLTIHVAQRLRETAERAFCVVVFRLCFFVSAGLVCVVSFVRCCCLITAVAFFIFFLL